MWSPKTLERRQRVREKSLELFRLGKVIIFFPTIITTLVIKPWFWWTKLGHVEKFYPGKSWGYLLSPGSDSRHFPAVINAAMLLTFWFHRRRFRRCRLGKFGEFVRQGSGSLCSLCSVNPVVIGCCDCVIGLFPAPRSKSSNKKQLDRCPDNSFLQCGGVPCDNSCFMLSCL